eukprot:TRINITY_DN1028_c0_g1_i1.p1 TRINITY_DN1028_c0_g1~~TRINITY_DN1028_c0_g1_i1.p1  ORF type:complete len:657 (-),score=302.98 TRINITY_DN1028_c0_g1_i1:63-2033(-)
MKEDSTPDKSRLVGLYRELAKYGSLGEYEKALSTAHKILNLNSEEKEAYLSVVVALIRLDRFSDALKFMEAQERKYGELPFHRSYSLYRLNKPDQALEALLKEKKPDLKCKELEAQILYRMERYEESLAVYESMSIPRDDEFIAERETNKSAARVFTKPSSIPKEEENGDSSSYEILYNRSCGLISEKKYSEAEKVLKKAEAVCKELLREEADELDEEEIEKETGIIHVQLAYALQSQGKVKEAQGLYNSVLRSKPSDIGLLAVASNNLITLNKDSNIFDSRKRMKAATLEGLEHKLTSGQRRSIAYNSALLAMYTNQIEACRNLIQELESNYGLRSEEERDLILAGVLARSGKVEEAIQILLKPSSKFNLERVLIAAQLLLEKKDFKGVIGLFQEKMPKETLHTKTGLLSALVVLHMAVNDRSAAASLLKAAVNSIKNVKGSDMSIVWKKTAEFHLRSGELSVAAESLEELIKSNPGDQILLAQLVLAYAEFDLNKALQTSKKLPVFKDVSSLDVESLESTAFIGGGKKGLIPRGGVGLPSPDKKGSPDALLLKKRRHKKKKKQLPKNYDPNVEPDPERWIPKRERLAYRKHLKRERRNKGGEKFTGAQGTAAGQSDTFDYSSKKPTPKSPNNTPQPTASNNRRKQQKKKKKKGF